MSPRSRKRSRPNKDRVIVERRGGVLIVADDDDVRTRLCADLLPLHPEMRETKSTAEALEQLTRDPNVDVLVVVHEQEGMSGGALCQYVRAHAALANIQCILIADAGELTTLRLSGRIADDFLPRQWDADDLRVTVRNCLRAQARRRLIARRERRHAIDWLAMVLAHEINNPLAAAMANLSLVRERAHDDELDALLDESFAMLERIRDRTHAIRLRTNIVAHVAQVISPNDLVEALKTRLARHGRAVAVDAEISAPSNGHARWGLLVDAADAVVEDSLAYCAGAIAARVHVEEARLAVVVCIEGNTDDDPEIILEPRLHSANGAPPQFHAGLSVLEATFAEAGGQLFARPVEEGWRFGLTIPVEPIDAADDLDV